MTVVCLTSIHCQSYCCKLCMNQQSPEFQLINRLNNACVKINLCIHIITSCQIYTMYEMQHLIVLYKEHSQTYTLKNYCSCFV